MAEEKTVKEKAKAVLIRMSEAEHNELKTKAAKNRQTLTAFVRALLGFSLIALAYVGGWL